MRLYQIGCGDGFVHVCNVVGVALFFVRLKGVALLEDQLIDDTKMVVENIDIWVQWQGRVVWCVEITGMDHSSKSRYWLP